VQVRITSAPEAFIARLITRTRAVAVQDAVIDALRTVLDDPGASGAQKLEAAQKILDYLLHTARRAAVAERPDRTRTASDGHFHFLDLPDGQYTLTASLPGAGSRYGTAQVEATVSRDAEGNISMVTADIALPPTTIRGRVVDQDNNPVGMAEVRVVGSGERTFSNADIEAPTEIQGQYRLTGLEAGKRTVLVSARGYTTATQTVQLTQGDAVERNVQLEPGSPE
jgi:hypothetical protein